MNKKFYIIINPSSGTGSKLHYVEKLKAHITRRGWSQSCSITNSLEHTEKLILEALAKKYTAVIVAGGDGTVRVAAELVAGTQLPLLVIPTGTENLLSKELGFDGSLDAMAKALDLNHIKEVDMWKANDMCFMSTMGIGFDGYFIKQIHKIRLGNISRTSCLLPALDSFIRYGFPHIQVIADGRLVCDEPALVMLSNVSRFIIGSCINPDADMSDGVVDLCIYKCSNRYQRALFWLKVLTGKYVNDRKTSRLKCREISILSKDKDVPVHIDGEVGPLLPVNIMPSLDSVRFFFA